MTLTVAAYAQALALMPQHYREMAFDRVSVAMLDDKILAAHPNHPPIMFIKGEWHPLTFKETTNERPKLYIAGPNQGPFGTYTQSREEIRDEGKSREE